MVRRILEAISVPCLRSADQLHRVLHQVVEDGEPVPNAARAAREIDHERPTPDPRDAT
jgi:hypothetical protein